VFRALWNKLGAVWGPSTMIGSDLPTQPAKHCDRVPKLPRLRTQLTCSSLDLDASSCASIRAPHSTTWKLHQLARTSCISFNEPLRIQINIPQLFSIAVICSAISLPLFSSSLTDLPRSLDRPDPRSRANHHHCPPHRAVSFVTAIQFHEPEITSTMEW
jgi:hypothetical protein